MKLFFKIMSFINIVQYRISGGRWGSSARGMDILLLTTTGRKTGKKRVSPVMFLKHDQSFVIVASGGGSASHPGWYYNLQSNPNVEIQVRDRKLKVKAATITGNQRETLFEQFVKKASFFGDYQKNTTRNLPVISLTPQN